MSTFDETTTVQSGKELFIKMVISNWELQNTRLNSLLEKLSDERIAEETAPGRNAGIYILGHLAAVSDGMLPLLGLGERKYPELDKLFLTSPDKAGQEYPTPGQLRLYWSDINETLSSRFSQMEPSEWFEKHTSISEEDFAKEPHRNKLNILINRTNHQSYHFGQLIYLK
ncbi:hypothetical protein DYBT9275_01570 [Dyadobacter sp. CECT 9275]|uniref:DinB-like domain-containing protein n=1 Tax=Dyadobacter helix TaxID=2822344 RepID=A0A916J9N1_9BACT|nr:DinB family protein [Dyadobacter sp. CECT 9275]CAG4995176.1 hypothetical protein DYBT9275_01570 [Dyadobacter sp. CECT 9275]